MKHKSEEHLLVVIAMFWLLVAALPQLNATAATSNGDAERGKQLFEKRCTGCHSLDSNKEGPRLRGVYGRKAGALEDFNYSAELKAAHIVWDERSLDQWLIDPDAVVHDNDMAFHVSNPQERADIIQFLRLSSGK